VKKVTPSHDFLKLKNDSLASFATAFTFTGLHDLCVGISR